MESPAPPAHVPEVDQLKGFAILCVICIHAKVLEGTLVHEHLINRAVPILLILFGLVSELSFRRAEDAARPFTDVLKNWYKRRAVRLLPGMWAALATCIAAAQVLSSWSPSLGDVIGALIGYAPEFGTSWFTILILQFVLVFPLIRGILVRAGTVSMLAFGAVVSGVSIWRFYDIVEFAQSLLGYIGEGWYYHWIFSPRVLFHVVVGMALAGGAYRSSRVLLVVSAALVVAGPFLVPFAGTLTDPFRKPLAEQLMSYALDAPLTVLLLAGFARLRVSWLQATLTWCGARTWGIYLGHMVVFEVAHVLRLYPEVGDASGRAVYALVLVASGVGLSLVGSVARAGIVRVWRPARLGG